MKPLRYFLGFLACVSWFAAGQAVADELRPKQIELPKDVKPLAPVDMNPIFYTSDGPDALMVLESKEVPSSNNYPNPKTRLLILLKKQQGAYKEIARSDKIFACSTCGDDMDDPFVPEGITLTLGHLIIEQDYGAASRSIYKFLRHSKSNRWIVVSAIDIKAEQSFATTNFIRRSRRLALPSPPLLINFDPRWHTPEFWMAVVVNDKTRDFSLPSNSNNRSLNEDIEQECRINGVCHVLLLQKYGCVSLIKDGKGASFAGASFDQENGRHEAENKALKECAKAGGTKCKVAAFTNCSPSYK